MEVLKAEFALRQPAVQCPDTYTYSVGVYSACRKVYVEWMVGSSVTSIAHNPNTPWYLYQLQIDAQGGVNPMMVLKFCGAGCCFADVRLCWQNGVPVVVSSPFSPAQFACPSSPQDQSCKMYMCAP
ncbi:MAG TPA: hypothetical protein PLW14_06800 [Chlorobiota bacterium]|nr:hypothetical protein [Chlorobiota bacterium]